MRFNEKIRENDRCFFLISQIFGFTKFLVIKAKQRIMLILNTLCNLPTFSEFHNISPLFEKSEQIALLKPNLS